MDPAIVTPDITTPNYSNNNPGLHLYLPAIASPMPTPDGSPELHHEVKASIRHRPWGLKWRSSCWFTTYVIGLGVQ
jgi:hypothetical protein